MGIFNDVFNKSLIYETLFFNVKSVLAYPNLKELEANNAGLYKSWEYIAKTKYNNEDIECAYLNHASYYSEFSKIVAITYAILYLEDGKLKREFKKIVNDNEEVVVKTFIDELNILSSAATKSTPEYFPTLCGYNIISNDIPLLIKRYLLHNKESQEKQLPLILKRVLSIKPWESGVIDVVNVWKFNGYDIVPLILIADFLGLKRTVELLSLEELSKYYWDNINEKSKETLEFIALQSATQTNLVIQLMNELREH